jgi:hypothetical protein
MSARRDEHGLVEQFERYVALARQQNTQKPWAGGHFATVGRYWADKADALRTELARREPDEAGR